MIKCTRSQLCPELKSRCTSHVGALSTFLLNETPEVDSYIYPR